MRKFSSGITLLELMMTVAIVAILASIAYPSYQDQVRRSNRTEAKAELMKAAQELEKCYTMSSKYTGCAAGAAITATYSTPNGRYKIAEGAGGIKDTTFEVTATAIGPQVKDEGCATLTMNEKTEHKAATSGGTDSSLKCWK